MRCSSKHDISICRDEDEGELPNEVKIVIRTFGGTIHDISAAAAAGAECDSRMVDTVVGC